MNSTIFKKTLNLVVAAAMLFSIGASAREKNEVWRVGAEPSGWRKIPSNWRYALTFFRVTEGSISKIGDIYVEINQRDGRDTFGNIHILERIRANTALVTNLGETINDYRENREIDLNELRQPQGAIAAFDSKYKLASTILKSSNTTDDGGTIEMSIITEAYEKSPPDRKSIFFEMRLQNGQIVATKNGTRFNIVEFDDYMKRFWLVKVIAAGVKRVALCSGRCDGAGTIESNTYH